MAKPDGVIEWEYEYVTLSISICLQQVSHSTQFHNHCFLFLAYQFHNDYFLFLARHVGGSKLQMAEVGLLVE